MVRIRYPRGSFPVEPLLLEGHRATVRLDGRLPPGSDLQLVLSWAPGETTELATRLVRLDEDQRTAHLAVRGVTGDWRPFCDFLGRRG